MCNMKHLYPRSAWFVTVLIFLLFVYRFLSEHLGTGANMYLSAMSHLCEMCSEVPIYADQQTVSRNIDQTRKSLKRARKSLKLLIKNARDDKTKRWRFYFPIGKDVQKPIRAAASDKEELKAATTYFSKPPRKDDNEAWARDWDRTARFLVLNALLSTFQRPGAAYNLTPRTPASVR